jgi:DNA-binding response OmpR family regulator
MAMKENPSKKWRILLIDDEPVIKRTYARILTNCGYEVDTASDGIVAMGMVIENKYDIVITDVHMPGLSGISFYESLKVENFKRPPRMIFISGDVLSNNIDDFCKARGEWFLPKPFTPDELTEIVRKVTVEIKDS